MIPLPQVYTGLNNNGKEQDMTTKTSIHFRGEDLPILRLSKIDPHGSSGVFYTLDVTAGEDSVAIFLEVEQAERLMAEHPSIIVAD